MDRFRTKSAKGPMTIGHIVLVGVITLIMAGCGEVRDIPRPPQSPPKPVTDMGRVTTAQLILDARPVPPKPGMM